MADSTISFARGAPSLDIIDVEGLRDASARAFANDPAGATAYGTSVGYPRLRAWIAERHGVEPEQVLVTNGSMQADAFLFEHLVQQGRRRGGGAPHLRPHAALAVRTRRAGAPGGAVAGRHRHRRARRPAGGTIGRPARAPEARPHHPQLPEPRRLHARAGQAQRAARAGGGARLHGVRGRPLRGAALQRPEAPDDALDGPRARGVRVVVLQDGVPRHPRRLPGGASPS